MNATTHSHRIKNYTFSVHLYLVQMCTKPVYLTCIYKFTVHAPKHFQYIFEVLCVLLKLERQLFQTLSI